MKILRILLALVLLLYICGGLYLYIKQRYYLYFPQPYTQNLYPNINIKVNNNTINIIHLKNSPAISNHKFSHAKPAIIYFGGNAEAVIHNHTLFQPLMNHYDVFLVNYRGYGQSTGEITEANNYNDALAVYTYVSKNHRTIHVVGRSIGTGVATFLASKRSVNKLVLITPYDSMLSLVKTKFPFYPIHIMLKDTYPSMHRANEISSNVLILSAKNDTLIPVHHAENLNHAFAQRTKNKPLLYQEIEEANHNNIMTKKSALNIFYAFFKQN